MFSLVNKFDFCQSGLKSPILAQSFRQLVAVGGKEYGFAVNLDCHIISSLQTMTTALRHVPFLGVTVCETWAAWPVVTLSYVALKRTRKQIQGDG